MFAFCRSPLRLATSVPVLRPLRIPPRYSTLSNLFDPPAPSNLFEKTPSHNKASPDLGDLIIQVNNDHVADPPASEHPTSAPWATDYISPVQISPYRFHCHSTRTNTINSFTDPDGNVLAWFSGGSTGFKKRNRSSYEAGYQCAVQMFEKILQTAQEVDKDPSRPLKLDLFFKGFGQGREALNKALMTAQGDGIRSRIVSITDRTPLKIGGTRAKKRKRR
ncbi:hypothetical protein C8R43DRAFT_105108 [Mycena crocata]|nr:hypothetical protein C8R43DRAFT_105108 [Mycena crocata]